MPKITVNTTNNLAMFKFHEMNRETNKNHVKRLATNIRENGAIRQPVVIDSRGNLIDGQHRVLAVRQLKDEGVNIDIPYIVKRYTPTIIAEMNHLQLAWNTRDWIHFYHKKGDTNYTQLLETYSKYNSLKLTGLASFLSPGYSQLSTSELCKGAFVFEMTEEKEYMLDQVKELIKFHPSFGTKAFLMAIMRMSKLPSFSSERLFSKLRANLGSVHPQSGIGNWCRHLVYWYNKGLRIGRVNPDDLPRSY